MLNKHPVLLLMLTGPPGPQPQTKPNTKSTQHVVAVLNSKWRVVDDGELQWILQRRRGRTSVAQAALEPSGKLWSGESFCDTRASLIRCIKEKVFHPVHVQTVFPAGPYRHKVTPEALRALCAKMNDRQVDPKAMQIILALPDKHPQPYVQRMLAKHLRAKRGAKARAK